MRIYFAHLLSTTITNAIPPAGAGATAEQREQYVAALNRRNGFYDRLWASIGQRGVVNPILVCAGYCVEQYRQWVPNWDTALVCDRHGGSRLWIAQQMGLIVPCVISDFTGQFEGFEELAGVEGVRAKFPNPPNKIVINGRGVWAMGPDHLHLT